VSNGHSIVRALLLEGVEYGVEAKAKEKQANLG
jgi:hypothetical protein